MTAVHLHCEHLEEGEEEQDQGQGFQGQEARQEGPVLDSKDEQHFVAISHIANTEIQ